MFDVRFRCEANLEWMRHSYFVAMGVVGVELCQRLPGNGVAAVVKQQQQQ